MNAALKSIKSSLRLPNSKFPPRPPPEAIKRYVARCDALYTWQQQHRPALIDQNGREASPDQTDATNNTFVLHDGPPYANGDLHVGHALNKITKDIICRTQLAKGKRVSYVPGWDCHGLPIEVKAFEKSGWERGAGIDPVKIRGAARGFAGKTVDRQMKTFRSWGIMADWDNHWKTMDKDFELRQLAVFKSMTDHGLIVRRHKPVYWSPSSQTALAEAEIERGEHVSTAAIVKFKIPAVVAGVTEPIHAVIWTTTPWTIPSNQAIAIHQDLKYVLVRCKSHGLLIVGQTRVEYLAEKLQEEVEIVKTISATEILACTYSGLSEFGPDALNRPFVHADFVSADEGTGLVHCAPGHGQDDYEVLQPLIANGTVKLRVPVTDKGEFSAEATPAQPELLAGKYVFGVGNKAVLELLRTNNALVASYDFKHKYPVDWRTKQPIMIRATAQWFADISRIRDDVVKSLDNVKFLPATGKSRLRSFVETRNEWCISRQRAWGVPIPAIYHVKTSEPVLTAESIDHIISVIQQRGIDAWWSDPVNEPAWIMPGLQADQYVRGRDTMDVWFDSGTSWTHMAQPKGNSVDTAPTADVYFEGSDQHRGWFQSSILTSIAFQKSRKAATDAHAPYRQLITHGFTLDGQGKKMSKSLGNTISPDQIVEGLTPATAKPSRKGRVTHPLGPDALRLWAATGDWTSDVVISDKVVGNVHKALDKYRVTFKVLLGMLSDFDPQKALTYDELTAQGFVLQRLALLQLHQVTTKVKRAMTDFETHKALAAINEWIATDVSGFYLESIKDSIYCDVPQSASRLASQTVLYHIFRQLQQMLGPVTPLLIEETWEFTPEMLRKHDGHPLEQTWRNVPETWYDQELSHKSLHINALNSAVKAAQEQARADKVLGQSLACEVVIYATPDLHDSLSSFGSESLQDLLVISRLKFGNSPSSDLSKESAGLDLAEAAQLFEGALQNEDTISAARLAIVAQYVRGSRENGTASDDSWAYSREIRLSDTGDESVAAIVLVTSPSLAKCQRCWKYNAPVQTAENAPNLCTRCEDAMLEHI